MRRYRKQRRPGNQPIAGADFVRIVAAKGEVPCCACWVWAHQLRRMPVADVAIVCTYDHKKSGNIRRGHRHGFNSCDWHHQGYVLVAGWTHDSMRAHFGPSLVDGSRLFHATYGSDDDLIAINDELLKGVFGESAA